MARIFFWLAVILAGSEWVIVWTGRRKARRITKPGTMLALLGWFSLVGHWRGSLVWFGLALVFSLAGDIFLLLPYRFFLGGLGAFLLGHICMIVGFNQTPPPLTLWDALILAGVGCIVLAFLKKIQTGLIGVGKKKLRRPVFLYGIAIGIMLVSAFWTLQRPEWPLQAAILVSLGASFFVFSDSLLAYHRFVRPVRFGEVGIMISYHIGQFLLAGGVLLAFAQA